MKLSGWTVLSLLAFSVPGRSEVVLTDGEIQPLVAHVRRVVEAVEWAGQPLPESTRTRLDRACNEENAQTAGLAIQAILDPLCWGTLDLAASGGIRVSSAVPSLLLVEKGWKVVWIKVQNQGEQAGRLVLSSPMTGPIAGVSEEEGRNRWMEIEPMDFRPLKPHVSGIPLEYRAWRIYADRELPSGTVDLHWAWEPFQDAPVGRWSFETGLEGWHGVHDGEVMVESGVLSLQVSGRDPWLLHRIQGEAGTYELTFQARVEQGSQGQFFWWTPQRPRPDGDHRVNFDFPSTSGRWETFRIRFDAEEELAGIRLDPGSTPGRVELDDMELRRIRSQVGQIARWTVPVEVQPAHEVRFEVRDEKGSPTLAAFEIRDEKGHQHPMPSKRLAPDFFFHPQVYRADGETLLLSAGRYQVKASRGPESIPQTFSFEVGPGLENRVTYQVQRWIDPSLEGWWSGDHHIHAAGCRHYDQPTEGVLPEDMARHIRGEDLKVGANLTWGPCFDYQKTFFSGAVHPASLHPYLLRYDIEVSGFGSHQSGHLCLLNLRKQIFPGGDSTGHWPTFGLNTLKWAKAQGAITGPAHSAIGLRPTGKRSPGQDGPGGLPNFFLPAYDGIGANEFIVDITHEVPGPDGKLIPAVDFISTMDTDRVAEWNMWYHVLNCGFRIAASGETDFPCISGDRVGAGRVYVKVPGPLTYDAWCEGLAAGRSYVSDGSTHFKDFRLSLPKQVAVLGEGEGELHSAKPVQVGWEAQVAVRTASGEAVKVELILNGRVAYSREVRGDGRWQALTGQVEMEQSGWLALRVFPSGHTNPLRVLVGGKPIRASRDSAEWLLRGLDPLWEQKSRFYSSEEREAAREAYDHARRIYRQRIAESATP